MFLDMNKDTSFWCISQYFIHHQQTHSFFQQVFFFKRLLFIHERHREKEVETQAEGEADPSQGARRGTRSRVSRIRPWAEGRAKPLSHLGCLLFTLFRENQSTPEMTHALAPEAMKRLSL